MLDRRFPNGVRVLTDDELQQLVGEFVAAAKLARDAGFAFVDLKHCHGYLGHELLGSRSRPGRYGGSLENRTRFLREIIEGIRAEVPGLMIGVRLSVFDTVPYRPGADRVGEPEPDDPGGFGFGVLTGQGMDAALEDARFVIRLLTGLGVRAICVSGGTPYYNPHVQRPALFPPVDGYEPPEDPLRGVARQIDATARLKADFPDVAFVGSAYSYLQEWLPHVAQRGRRQRPHGLRRPGAHRALVSGTAGRRARRRAAQAQVHLPHLQRLHDRDRGWDWCPAVIRSIRTTRRRRKRRASSRCAPSRSAEAKES